MKAGLQPSTDEGRQTKPQSSSRSRAGSLREIQSELPFSDNSKTPQTTLGHFKILGTHSFLRSVNACRSALSEQGVLNVDCDKQFFEPTAFWGRLDELQSREIDPFLNRGSIAIREFPTQRPSQTESRIVSRAATDADETASRTFPDCCLDYSRKAKRIQLEWMKLSARQHGQADCSSGFDDRSFRFWLPPPFRATQTMSGINRSRRHDLSSQQCAHCFTKSVPAVGNGQEFQRIVRPHFTPAARNGPRCCAGGQRAFEFVWSD
jgi:hypothetical protein